MATLRYKSERHPPVVANSLDVWYLDGNVVLQAENLRFRVHKSILSKHSHVFRDLFLLATPSDAPVEEGCPVVTIHDAEESTEHALKALYGQRSYYDHGRPMRISVVAALLDFGKKYGIKQLQEEAESRLRHELPCSLAAWDKAYDGWSLIEDEDGVTQLATDLLWRHDISIALPAALYACSLRPVADIMYGRQYDAGLVLLNDRDLRARIVVGKEDISRACAASDFVEWLESDEPKAGCGTTQKCHEGRFAIYRALWGGFSNLGALDPWWERWDRRLCDQCRTVAKEKYESTRQEIWAKLPAMFKLPAWEDLLAQSND
ncbi:hypothetical protein PUNSTDRAFT_140893 [Punctularia strigosozonata HHB-11173 SS5]|uniref:uncharacterized protein n=1 Tax=Punctularia strigosozonata (strain HHB-11173) TaxID=741275 RepID=UPI0004418283|nr:uncharacterized protein PUNSTDRAFT_140893 [Punctularia strigosozonata HHB-11173 SS5]EIN14657.1 hypothetical protein PUNSTDRAFT_140893 [Punctularia strigosozonata HHB-11173 SS5]